MYYVWLVVMWASGFVCGGVVAIALARAVVISTTEVDERDAFQALVRPNLRSLGKRI